jgi:mono/diheme cytochrome c family protein
MAGGFTGIAVMLGVIVSMAAVRGQAPPQIKTVPCKPLVSVEGKDTYGAYCAVCHGADGKGQGPAAAALKGPVPDLTMIAKRHGGKFDAIAMQRVVSGADKVPLAHGSIAMPIWGPLFKSADVDPNVAKLRVENLVKYLESIQAT